MASMNRAMIVKVYSGIREIKNWAYFCGAAITDRCIAGEGFQFAVNQEILPPLRAN